VWVFEVFRDPLRKYSDFWGEKVVISYDCSGTKSKNRMSSDCSEEFSVSPAVVDSGSCQCTSSRTNMKQVILTGLAAALTVSVAGKLSTSEANQAVVPDSDASADAASQGEGQPSVATKPGTTKVGEQQPGATAVEEAAIATIQVHQSGAQQASTVYVKGIPVVTFLGDQKAGAAGEGVKVASGDLSATDATSNFQDPQWRATAVAARINQLSQQGVDAKNIKVSWDNKRQSYLIRANGEHLVEVISKNTVLPKSTKDGAKDALEITNLLRRQMGAAAPLTAVEGMPKKQVQTVAVGPVRFQINGWASWYGPGFDGNATASGERFNQYDLTAAHRHLPFGTRVRVTNMDNGRTVVVRINDRGPFVGDRVIDLSKGAAQVLGVVGSGVAPVRVDVLN
jgi:rare lipoprotein A